MDDKNLLKKLNNLKTVKPDNEWKKNYREILYSQISAGSTDNRSKSNFRIIFENMMSRETLVELARPVWLAGAASIMLLVVGIAGVYASKNTKPGDSLYIAKIISEKTQLAMTFDEKSKASLSLEFAANRAKEITQVLKDAGQSAESDKVKDLSLNFKKEISQAKDRLASIKASGKQSPEDEQVFGANAVKDNRRMEIAEPAKPEAKKDNADAKALNIQAEPSATSTAQISGQAGKMLEEAEKLFDEKDYNGTINKLEEVNKVINRQSDNGQVKGESETATSTK